MPKSIWSLRGVRCADGRLHATLTGANDCLHHPADKDFDAVNQAHPPITRNKTKLGGPEEIVHGGEDVNDDGRLPAALPFTPASKNSFPPASNSPSPLAKPGLPTPPVSQPLAEEMGDNIVVAMAPSSQVIASSPVGDIRRSPPRSSPPSCGPRTRDVSRTPSPEAANSAAGDDNDDAATDTDDILGPLSSSPPPAATSAHTPPPAAAAAGASTTHITETNPDDAAPTISSTTNTDEANTLLALRADRARLTDALATSTFRAANLLTRAKLAHIEAQLARRAAQMSDARIADARAEAAEAWGAVEDALAVARNAWASAGIMLGIAAAYAVWCWLSSVEMAYVRKRTCVGFGMREDC